MYICMYVDTHITDHLFTNNYSHVYNFIYVDDVELDLTLLCTKISRELKALECRCISRDRPTEWQSRINRREESWDEIRNLLLNAVIRNHSLPPSNVSNYVCTLAYLYMHDGHAGLYFLWR